MKRPILLLVALAAVLAACAPPPMVPRRRDSTGAQAPSPTPEPTEQGEKPKRFSIIMAAHPEGDPDALATILEAHPNLKLTLIFPPGYFDAPERNAAAQRLSALQTAKQIEVALSLGNEPILPLLANLRIAGENVRKWGFEFSWPEDAAAQTARGSGRFRKRWGQLPSGFSPPHGAVSEQVMDVLRRFRLTWVLARPSEPWGIRFFGGTALMIPEPLTIDDAAPASESARLAAHVALARPYSVVDASAYPTPEFEREFLMGLAKSADNAVPLATAQEFVEGLRDEYEFPAGVDPFRYDYSAWVESPLQRRAWQALAEARQVIENYKNSGRANLNRLDAAVEEMCVAESGAFLLSLSDPQGSTTFAQRNFLATLANVYRLAGVPVPANLGNWFADRSLHRASTRPTDNDRPFFVEGPQSLTWNDPKSDDNGAGAWTYPLGGYPKGAFDLRDVSISWTETDVTFTASVVDLPRAGSVSVTPLVDVYIDVNRLSEAGSTAVLSRRGQAALERDAAWEYAVAVTPGNAALYQALPGGEQRLLSVEAAQVTGNSFAASFSRRVLRGEPRRWRLTAACGGAETTQREEPPVPVSVQASASQRAFGGAPGPRMPPRYIDLLVDNSDAQANRLGAYAGGTVILPYVEAE